MDMRTMPPIINSASSASVTGSAPQLGAMVPGTTGGMPAVSGLSVTQNPMAKQLQSYGRGDDKMLVHMTPGEVGGLQQLAMAHGGSLSINPQTGLPEAGFLSKLLPTLIGFGLAATGVGAPLAAGMVAAGQTALTGDLSKGLMAGLGAFGGAGLAGAAGVGGSLLGGNAGGLLGEGAGVFGANMGLGAAPSSVGAYLNSPELAQQFATKFGSAGAGSQAGTLGATVNSAMTSPDVVAKLAAENTASTAARAASGIPTAAGQTAATAAPAITGPAALPGGGAQFTGGLFDKFGQATRQGLGGAPKILSKNAPMLAGIGALSSVAGAMQPSMPTYNEDEEDNFKYEGPFVPGKREVSFQSDEDMRASGGAEYMGFTPSNPPPRRVADLTPEERSKYGFAEGGSAMVAPYNRYGSDTISPSSSMIVPAELSAPSAARAEPPAFGDLKGAMDFFGATSPGAITASMRPTTPKQVGAGEEKYSFNTKANPLPPVMGGGNLGGDFGFGNFDLSYLNDLNDRFGRMEQQVLNPDYSSINDRFGQLENRFGEQLMQIDSGLDDRFNQYDSQLNIMQDSITPALSGINDRFGQLEGRFGEQLGQIGSGINDRFGQLEDRFGEQLGQIDSGIDDRFGQIENRFDTLPTTDFSGINDRLGQFESRFDDRLGQIDSGINNRFGQIESRFDTMPAPAATDLSGVYDRLGQFENRFDDRLGQIDSRFDTLPTPAATDLSGVYDQLGQINSRFDTLPTPAATDFSGIYDRLGQIDSRFDTLPTPTAPDLSGIYDRLGQIDSRFDTMPVENDFGNYGQFEQLGENFARGGEVDMRNGSFVVDARTVSELGNGSSNAGMELLARMGGRPLQGPGDGVSDSIRARIGGKQEARVARDEVLFSPEAVKRLGKGSEKRGTAKLYDLMNKAHKARKKAKRGQDTKVRKGLA
jgi:hypothetical protein